MEWWQVCTMGFVASIAFIGYTIAVVSLVFKLESLFPKAKVFPELTGMLLMWGGLIAVFCSGVLYCQHAHAKETWNIIDDKTINDQFESVSIKIVGIKWEYVVVHHTVTPPDMVFDTARCNEIHISEGYSSCAYNVLIQRDGTVEFARGMTNIGAHSGPHFNRKALGVAFVMDGTKEEPTPEALNAFRAWLNQARNVFGPLKVIAHRDVKNTLCPTDSVWNQIKHHI